MDLRLQHDPRTKQQIKDAIYNFLYEPVLNELKNRLESLILKNCILLGNPNHSFSYRGVSYDCTGGVLPRKRNRLLPQLYSLMDDYLKDLHQLNQYELPFVLGYITHVMNSSNELHDYFKLLPTAVHQPVAQLISTCPCRASKLSASAIQELQSNNKVPISLIRNRLVTNLLL